MVMEGKVDGVEEACEVMLHQFLVSNKGRLFFRMLVYVGGFVSILSCAHRVANVDNSGQQFTFCWHCTEKSPLSTERQLLASIQNLR